MSDKFEYKYKDLKFSIEDGTCEIICCGKWYVRLLDYLAEDYNTPDIYWEVKDRDEFIRIYRENNKLYGNVFATSKLSDGERGFLTCTCIDLETAYNDIVKVNGEQKGRNAYDNG